LRRKLRVEFHLVIAGGGAGLLLAGLARNGAVFEIALGADVL
jgi:hypothetical protein